MRTCGAVLNYAGDAGDLVIEALRHSFQMETTLQTADSTRDTQLTENDRSVPSTDSNCIIYYWDWE